MLSLPACAAGLSATLADGGTLVDKVQRQLTLEREEVRHTTMRETMDALPANDQRRIAYMDSDKCATAFVAALPLPGEIFDNTELRCSWQAYLGVPQTMLDSHVGMSLNRGKTLDKHGCALTTMNCCGDGWRRQHDEIKEAIAAACAECGVEFTMEVYGLFAAYVGQNNLNGSSCQALVPDFMLTLKNRRSVLFELKTLHQGVTWNARAVSTPCGALEKREGKIHREYHSKARNADIKFNGHNPQDAAHGPVQTRLSEFGPIQGGVAGPRGSVSSGLHRVIEGIAEIGAERNWRAMGARSVLEARAVLINRVRRGIGIVATRAAARLMIGRLGVARGDGRKAAERRRNAKSYRRSFEWENFFANGPKAFSGGQPRKGC